MNKNSKLYAIISYITWIGWIIALVKSDREDSLVYRHLNQALVLNLIATAASALSRLGGIFNTVGAAADLLCLVLSIMGIVRAFRMSEEPLPLIGEIDLLGRSSDS